MGSENFSHLALKRAVLQIEGTASLFHCGVGEDHRGCLIGEVMANAEQQVEDYLKERRLVDCAIIGGGPAGLNAALVLGRARRSVKVFDDNQPRNAVTDASPRTYKALAPPSTAKSAPVTHEDSSDAR